MHEMSLCEGILRILEEQAKTEHFTKVQTVRLEIGKLAAVEIEALRFSFDVVMRHSLAADAKLEIISVPGEAYCFDCESEVQIEDRLDPCPKCGSYRISPTGGDEMRIKDLEVT